MSIHFSESLGRFKLSDEGQRIRENHSMARLQCLSLVLVPSGSLY